MRAVPIRAGHTRRKNEENDLFRCPRCGFINWWSKTSLPGYASVVVEDVPSVSDGGVSVPDMAMVGVRDTLCTVDGVDIHGATMGVGSDGVSAVDVYYSARKYAAGAGCRFCGQVWITR